MYYVCTSVHTIHHYYFYMHICTYTQYELVVRITHCNGSTIVGTFLAIREELGSRLFLRISMRHLLTLYYHLHRIFEGP